MLPFLGPRTLDSGFWTGLTLHTYHYLRPDAGPRTPDSGLRTRDSPRYLLTYPPIVSKHLLTYLLTPSSLPVFFPSGPGTLNLRICFKVGDGAAHTRPASPRSWRRAECEQDERAQVHAAGLSSFGARP